MKKDTDSLLDEEVGMCSKAIDGESFQINLAEIEHFLNSHFNESHKLKIEPQNTHIKITLEIESTVKAIVDTNEALENFYQRFFPQLDISLGFYELLVNAVEHGNNFDPEKIIKICIDLTEKCLKIAIEDQGKGFNWREKIDQPISVEDFAERGRGIGLASLFCDITYNEVGNRVTIVKEF